MKTNGISCVPKFRLLVFVGHPTDHPDHPNHLNLNDHPNQVSYNRDHQKIYQEDRYRICIAHFVLFQIILIYVQVLLSITLLEQRSDAIYAIFFGLAVLIFCL